METPPAEELLKKMLELEQSEEHLKQEMSRLTELRQPSYPMLRCQPLRKESRIQGSMNLRVGVGGKEPSAGKFTNEQYLNILQSMAQSVHVLDLNTRIIFWNAMSEKLYRYSAAEVVGQNPLHVILDDQDTAFALNVARRCVNGESWTGEFPVKSKSGDIFLVVTTCSPFYDDNGSVIGIISITSDIAPYLNSRISLSKLKAQEEETSSIPESNKSTDDEASSMWSSSINANNTSSVSSCGSTSRSVMEKIDTDSDCLEYEILWDDLTMGNKLDKVHVELSIMDSGLDMM